MKRNRDLYNSLSHQLSQEVTVRFSSSFGRAASLLSPSYRTAIYDIYGFVRLADEVVDSWRPHQMDNYLADLSVDFKRAVKNGFSANPIIHSFAATARKYKIPPELVDAFLKSMRMDVTKKTYSPAEYKQYIYGSAEAVGLMCLMVFVDGDKRKYSQLVSQARALGAAFQKINFLRDYASDSSALGRIYFPNLPTGRLDEEAKLVVVKDIKKDLEVARAGIKKLPKGSRGGVELAFLYFFGLTKKIEKTPSKVLLTNRIRLNKLTKLTILIRVKFKTLFY